MIIFIAYLVVFYRLAEMSEMDGFRWTCLAGLVYYLVGLYISWNLITPIVAGILTYLVLIAYHIFRDKQHQKQNHR